MNPPEWSPLDPTPTAGPVNEAKKRWASEHDALYAAYERLLVGESAETADHTDHASLNRAQRRAAR